MIHTKIYGGLGNQTFQLLYTISLAKKFNIKNIYFDLSSLGDYSQKRDFDLQKIFDLNKLPYNIFFKDSLVHKFRLSKVFCGFFNSYISDGNFNTNGKSNLYLDGYFQDAFSKNEFSSAIKALRKTLKFHTKVEDCLAIHVRGGDFLKLNWSSLASKEYYQKALRYMIKRQIVKKIKIITDDIEYCKTIFDKSFYKYIQAGSQEKDFVNIMNAKYRIMSNSTFCFIAASLNQDSGISIAPRFWTPDRLRNIKLNNEHAM